MTSPDEQRHLPPLPQATADYGRVPTGVRRLAALVGALVLGFLTYVTLIGVAWSDGSERFTMAGLAAICGAGTLACLLLVLAPSKSR